MAWGTGSQDCRRFILLILFIFVPAYVFIYKQVAIIESPIAFISLVVVLIIASFVSSAVEAAFSVASDKQDISEKVKEDLKSSAEKFSPLDAKIAKFGSAALSDAEQRQWNVYMKQNRKAQKIARSLDGTEKNVYVGSLATLSVFLNTSLAAFLPYTLSSHSYQKLVVIPYPTLKIADSDLKIVWESFDATGEKTLVFIAASVPILILGKIIPKLLGIRHYYFFSYRCNFLGRVPRNVFGWITLAVKWPLRRWGF